ncbi:recombinase [Beijerinckiaceae bacterium]|nr:recombinase [Beijerinckiaceae bacterium]
MYTIGQAAKATGKSKSTISAYVKKGAIAAKRNEDSSYSIDPADLHSVFPPVGTVSSSSDPQSSDPDGTNLILQNLSLRSEIKLLREQLLQKDSVIASLRQSLAEVEEQRKLALSMINWQQREPEPPPAPPRKGILAFLHSLIGV